MKTLSNNNLKNENNINSSQDGCGDQSIQKIHERQLSDFQYQEKGLNYFQNKQQNIRFLANPNLSTYLNSKLLNSCSSSNQNLQNTIYNKKNLKQSLDSDTIQQHLAHRRLTHANDVSPIPENVAVPSNEQVNQQKKQENSFNTGIPSPKLTIKKQLLKGITNQNAIHIIKNFQPTKNNINKRLKYNNTIQTMEDESLNQGLTKSGTWLQSPNLQGQIHNSTIMNQEYREQQENSNPFLIQQNQSQILPKQTFKQQMQQQIFQKQTQVTRMGSQQRLLTTEGSPSNECASLQQQQQQLQSTISELYQKLGKIKPKPHTQLPSICNFSGNNDIQDSYLNNQSNSILQQPNSQYQSQQKISVNKSYNFLGNFGNQENEQEICFQFIKEMDKVISNYKSSTNLGSSKSIKSSQQIQNKQGLEEINNITWITETFFQNLNRFGQSVEIYTTPAMQVLKKIIEFTRTCLSQLPSQLKQLNKIQQQNLNFKQQLNNIRDQEFQSSSSIQLPTCINSKKKDLTPKQKQNVYQKESEVLKQYIKQMTMKINRMQYKQNCLEEIIFSKKDKQSFNEQIARQLEQQQKLQDSIIEEVETPKSLREKIEYLHAQNRDERRKSTAAGTVIVQSNFSSHKEINSPDSAQKHIFSRTISDEQRLSDREQTNNTNIVDQSLEKAMIENSLKIKLTLDLSKLKRINENSQINNFINQKQEVQKNDNSHESGQIAPRGIFNRDYQPEAVMDFQDEFMSKIDEFSLSWRKAALSEEKFKK